jgi:hypothetical protein
VRRAFMMMACLATVAASAAPHTPTARCSRIADLVFGAKGMRMVYVLGTGDMDTVLTGPGLVQYDTGDGHFGAGPDRPIHGQRFAVEHIGSPASLPPSVTSVVLVPWDYGADCRTTPWGRSARWLPANERTLIIGSLRETRYWANGVPTVDVHLLGPHPYPQHEANRPLRDSALTADELFTLLEALPDAERLESAPLQAIAAFREWTIANPGIARRWPADGSLGQLRYQGEMALLRKSVPPILGTFRFAVSRPGRDSAVFFVRTDRRPTSRWHGRAAAPREPATDISAPDAYAIVVATGRSPQDLPLASDSESLTRHIGFFMMVHEPRTRPDGSREWDGAVEFREIEKTMLADRPVTDRPDRSATLGRFIMDPDGRVQVEMTIGRAEGRPVVLHGERISTAVMDSKWMF